MPQKPIDYDALAKKLGGSSQAVSPNLDALASAAGGMVDAPPTAAPTESSPMSLPAQVGTSMSAFGGGLWDTVNPIPALKALFTDPVGLAKNVGSSQGEMFTKAAEAFQQDRISEGLGYGMAWMLPLIGPAAAHAGETIGQGEIARGTGEMAGLLLPFSRVAKGPSAAGDMANTLDRVAENKLVRGTAPQIGPNKTRFVGNMKRVAGDVLRDPELGAWSRQGLQDALETKLNTAGAEIQSAAARIPKTRMIATKPVIDAIQGEINGLIRKGISGTPVEVASRKSLLQSLRSRLDEVRSLGSNANAQTLNAMRQDWDAGGKPIYSPSMTADFLVKQGEADGYATAAGHLRNYMGKQSPEIASANAHFSIYKSAADVLRATEEMELSRPHVGRNVIAKAGAGLVGNELAGTPGAIMGIVLGPVIESAMAFGPTTRIQTARLLARTADALRSRQYQAARVSLLQVAKMAGQSEAVPAINKAFAEIAARATEDDSQAKKTATTAQR